MRLEHLIKVTLFLILSLASPLVATADAQSRLSPHRDRLSVTPHPQEVFDNGRQSNPFQINANTTIRVLHDEDLPGAQLLARDVERRAGITLKTQKDTRETPTLSNVIFISRTSDDVTLRFPNALFSRIDVKQAEGYSLVIANDRVLIRATDARGAVYGIQTLRQLLRHDLTLPGLIIRDWPEMPRRMVYGIYNGPFNTKAALDGYVDRALLLKYNAIVFESNWNAGQNWWFNHAGERRELARYFQEACRKYHIDFIPLVQGPGWGYGVTDQAPMLSTGEWIEKEKLILSLAAPTALAQRNVVTNASAPIVVTDIEGKLEYQKDKDFKIIPGQTIRPYKPENAPWQLQAVEGGAIQEGQEVLVSYNAVTKSTPHQAWNISDPESFRIVDRTLDGVQASLNPSTIHIGHDEIWQLGKDSRDLQSGLTPMQLVQRDLMHWYNRIKKNNPDAEILMWDDLLRPGRTGVSNGILNEVAGDIPKDIVVVPWFYHAKPGNADIIKSRLEHLTGMGFSIIGAPAGYFRDNSYLWYQQLQPYLKDGRAKGMMFTSWDLLHRGDMVAAGELMWSGQKVDRKLYQALDAITERVKLQGLVLTLSPKVQLTAFVDLIAKGLKEKKTPDQINAEFKTKVIGDISAFRKVLGERTWNTLPKDAGFPEQEMANLVRVPLFLQAMTDAVKAGATQDKQLLRKVIDSLYELNHIGLAEHDELVEKSKTQWIDFKELFGVESPKTS